MNGKTVDYFSKSELLIILLASMAPCIAAFITKSLWGDEIWSFIFAGAGGQDFVELLTKDYHPPLYFLLLKVWIGTVGNGELSARVFQFLNGIFFFSGAILLIKRLFGSESKVFPVLLLGVSAEVWLFLPMLRYYAFTAGVCMFSTALLLTWVERQGWKLTLLLITSYAVILYTDYPASIMIGVHGLYVLLYHRERLLRLVGITFAAFCLFTPWFVVLVQQLSRMHNRDAMADLNNSPVSIVVKMGYSFYAFLFGETLYPFEKAAIAGIVLLVLIVLAGLNWKAVAGYKRQLTISLLALLCGLLFTSAITTYISTHTSFIYTPSRTFFVLPFLFIVLYVVYYSLKGKIFRYAFIAVLGLLNVYSISNYCSNRHFLMPVYASPWKEMIAPIRGENALVIADERMVYNYYRDYVYADLPPVLDSANVTLLKNALSSGTFHFFYVLSSGRESTQSEVSPEFETYVAANASLVSEQKFLPVDEAYRKFKMKITKRDSYDAKFTLRKYQVRPL